VKTPTAAVFLIRYSDAVAGENTSSGNKDNKVDYGMLCSPVLHKRAVSIAVKIFNNSEH
jgi:hypothetical protein